MAETHISHDVILALCERVAAQGAEVAALTTALEKRNGALDRVVDSLRGMISEMKTEREVQVDRCEQRFRDIEAETNPGLTQMSARFWVSVAGVVAVVNLAVMLLFRISGTP